MVSASIWFGLCPAEGHVASEQAFENSAICQGKRQVFQTGRAAAVSAGFPIALQEAKNYKGIEDILDYRSRKIHRPLLP
jgi:hypothetical protein